MEELNNNSVSGEETVDTENNYIAALNEMKQNSVSKAEYQKVVNENKQLIETLISNGQMENPEIKDPVDIEALRHDLARNGSKMTNLEYVSKVVDLRDAILESGGPDPFLPNSAQYKADFNDMATAERVANTFKHCIEYANGDSEVFTNELMRLTKDANPMRSRKY